MKEGDLEGPALPLKEDVEKSPDSPIFLVQCTV